MPACRKLRSRRSRTTTSSCETGHAGMLPEAGSSRYASSRASSISRAMTRGSRGSRPHDRPQAQRRPRNQHGAQGTQVPARGQARPHLPRPDRAPDPQHRRARSARVPLVLMNSFATDGDTQTALHRHPDLACRCRDHVRPEQLPQAPPRRPDADQLAREPVARVGAPRARRPVHGDRDVRNARAAAEATTTATRSSPTPTISERRSTTGSSPGSPAAQTPF